jgi:hypothetical protein
VVLLLDAGEGVLTLPVPSSMRPTRRCSRPVQRLGSFLAVSSVVLAEDKVVVAVVQQTVRHLSLPDLCRVLPRA